MSKKVVLIGIVSLAVLSALGWFFLVRPGNFQTLNPFSTSADLKPVEKTVENPLSGVKYKEAEAQGWLNQRPIGVMINNLAPARPQWGLNQAEIVYEAVAEGGITRYEAFFLADLPKKVGPIRSTRLYYLYLAKETGDAALMHTGSSPQAQEAINSWFVSRSLLTAGAQFERDQERLNSGVAYEHTAYADVNYLRDYALAQGWGGAHPFRSWLFKDDPNVYVSQPEATTISYDFWYPGDFSVTFKHDPTDNAYLRYTGYDAQDQPEQTIDANTKEPVKVKNVILQFASETPIAGDDKNRLDYELIGSGEGLVFLDGRVVKVTWSKSDREARTLFYDTEGREMQFNRGKFWISIVPDRNKSQVVY